VPGEAEPVGDLGPGAAGAKQRAGLHADVVEPRGGRADRRRCGGRRLASCRHAARAARILSPEEAKFFGSSLVQAKHHLVESYAEVDDGRGGC
jgi:hypothetical protein